MTTTNQQTRSQLAKRCVYQIWLIQWTVFNMTCIDTGLMKVGALQERNTKLFLLLITFIFWKERTRHRTLLLFTNARRMVIVS
jgi:hypothetical protein